MINIMINATAFWQFYKWAKWNKITKDHVIQETSSKPDSVVYFKTTARITSIAKFARCVRDRNDSKQPGLAHAPQTVSFVPRLVRF